MFCTLRPHKPDPRSCLLNASPCICLPNQLASRLQPTDLITERCSTCSPVHDPQDSKDLWFSGSESSHRPFSLSPFDLIMLLSVGRGGTDGLFGVSAWWSSRMGNYSQMTTSARGYCDVT